MTLPLLNRNFVLSAMASSLRASSYAQPIPLITSLSLLQTSKRKNSENREQKPNLFGLCRGVSNVLHAFATNWGNSPPICRKTPYLFTISSLIVFFYVLRRASSESLFSIFDFLPQQKTQVDAVLVAIM